jgi:hypothetical protein
LALAVDVIKSSCKIVFKRSAKLEMIKTVMLVWLWRK